MSWEGAGDGIKDTVSIFVLEVKLNGFKAWHSRQMRESEYVGGDG